MATKVGDRFPDVELMLQDGRVTPVSEIVAGKPAVLFFYPKDHTPGCTAEVCAFRDAYEDFTDAGVQVIGVSDDGPEAHAGFKAKHRLPFMLVTDPGGKARKRLGTSGRFSLVPGRVTFVVDATGTVVHRFDSQLNATKHVQEALRAVA